MEMSGPSVLTLKPAGDRASADLNAMTGRVINRLSLWMYTSRDLARGAESYLGVVIGDLKSENSVRAIRGQSADTKSTGRSFQVMARWDGDKIRFFGSKITSRQMAF
jgi:hypothetical protein